MKRLEIVLQAIGYRYDEVVLAGDIGMVGCNVGHRIAREMSGIQDNWRCNAYSDKLILSFAVLAGDKRALPLSLSLVSLPVDIVFEYLGNPLIQTLDEVRQLDDVRQRADSWMY